VANLFGGWLDRNFADPVAIARVPPDRFAANLDAMLAAARGAGARALVAIPPFSPKLRAKRAAIPRYEAILRERAAAAGARTVELGPRFADPAADFQRDQIHPSALGQRRIAEAVAAALLAD
jgi:lysophospholipase L1-like esterase